MKDEQTSLRLTRLGIDTYKEAIVYMREDCHICHTEGFSAQTRIKVKHGSHSIIATLNTVKSNILKEGEIGLSEHAWELLNAREGGIVSLSHPQQVRSLPHIRSKIYNHRLDEAAFTTIVNDIVSGRLSDIQISAFLSACAADRLNLDEIVALSKAMIKSGKTLTWDNELIVDKHCVGGIPGNRTTLILVPIVAAYGLTIPKTSSRAITSPSGTADTMEVLAPVQLDIKKIRKVVANEGGCIAWGGSVSLSPADDLLIHVERSLNFDSEGQMVASVLSKKIAAGSTHVVIDIPVGETAKVRSQEMALLLQKYLMQVGKSLGLKIAIFLSDGSQPIGRGIGPALEARDVLQVLQNLNDAPQDLRERSLQLSARVLELSGNVATGKGYQIASDILKSGRAWEKFQSICIAQGGMHQIPTAPFTHTITAEDERQIVSINNRKLSRLARLSGAPIAKSAGIDMHVKLSDHIIKGQPLFTIHAESKGELNYALNYLNENTIIDMEPI